MKRIETINQAFIIVLCIFCAFMFGLLGSQTSSTNAAADTKATSYTGALEDLQTDESFTQLNYPEIANDYSLSVVQIAESVNGELFVYVYQPCAASKRFYATSINISTGINDNLSYKNYKLVFLNADGVFFKYMVKDFTVKADKVRYYDISNIYRAWDEDLNDKKLPEANENKIAEVSFGVEKQYTACTVEGEVSYSCLEPEYITITDKYVGRIRYGAEEVPLWFKLLIPFTGESAVDSWIVAFSTDMPIDKLMEADVYYLRQDVYITALGAVGYATPKAEKYAYLNYTEKRTYEAGFYNKNTYSWSRIQSVSDYVATEKLTEEGKKAVEDKQWVLRFTETAFVDEYFIDKTIPYYAKGSLISDVTILRLKFETDGVVYNLGVVDNKQSLGENQGVDNPPNEVDPLEPFKPGKDKDGKKSGWDKFVQFWKDAWAAIKKFFTLKLPWWLYAAVIGVALGIVLPILGLIFPPVMAFIKLVLKGLWKGIKFLFKALWWLISAPFRFIAWLVKKRKNKKVKPEQKSKNKQIKF